MLDLCGTYSNLWRIKFNAAKSSLMEFGPQFFNNSHFYIDNTLVPKVDHIKYLGVKIDKHLNFKDSSIEKFKNVQRSVFSLSFLGLKPHVISPNLQSFIYKTFCLSQFTYSLETTVINRDTRNYLNVCQNNILRQIIGLKKYAHMSKVLKSLRIFNFEDLYSYTKLSFLNSIKQNKITESIFQYLCNSSRKKILNHLSKTFGCLKKGLIRVLQIYIITVKLLRLKLNEPLTKEMGL